MVDLGFELKKSGFRVCVLNQHSRPKTTRAKERAYRIYLVSLQSKEVDNCDVHHCMYISACCRKLFLRV